MRKVNFTEADYSSNREAPSGARQARLRSRRSASRKKWDKPDDSSLIRPQLDQD